MPTPNLQAVVDKIEPAVTAVTKVKDSAKKDSFVEMAIEENLNQSVRDLLALRHGKDQGKLTVFEAEYHLETGEVVRLDRVKRSSQEFMGNFVAH